MFYLNTVEQIRSDSRYLTNLKFHVKSFFENPSTIADFVYNTSAIEGSTLTLNETLTLVKQEGTFIEGKSAKDSQETLGAIEANYLLSQTYNLPINEDRVLNLHRKLMERSRPEIAGKYRTDTVYTMVADKEIPQLISKYFYPTPVEMLNTLDKLFAQSLKMSLPEIAIYKMEFVNAHPFKDGNGRLSRLILNWLLIYNDYPPVNITVEQRESYIDAMTDFSKYNDPSTFQKMLEELVLTEMEKLTNKPQKETNDTLSKISTDFKKKD